MVNRKLLPLEKGDPTVKGAALLISAAAVAALATGGGALAVADTGVAIVNVTLKDSGIQVNGVTAPGKVTFVVQNAGTAAHELVVLRTNMAPRALPMSGKQARETGLVGDTKKIARGAVKRLTLTLAPGKYVLLSNLPGDYKRGMVAGFALKGSIAVTPPQESTVDVSAFEMGFKLSAATVPHGTVTFKVHNDGQSEHDFRIEGKGTATLEPGASESLSVPLLTPGKYLFLCTIPGHAAAGMKGTLTVT